ncbi:MAG: hypothetical protein ACOY5B_06745 [Spirochaetota bacterium]
MLVTVAVTVSLFAFFAAALGLSLFFGRKPIAGSCGGLGAELCVVCSPEQKAECTRRPQAR